ncbi:MAG TPA: orotate phosphoribosyltransferase [Pseudomonadales bacterium]
MSASRNDRSLVAFLIEQGVLAFGDFTLKSGRRSPYFFNLGALNTGSALARLGAAYAERIRRLDVPFDVVFGPAYKGIPIAVSTAEALAALGGDVGWAFNRKEAKSHGEGGLFVGADVSGRVMLVDDVLTAGTAVREAAALIGSAGAAIAGVVIALDRQERVAPNSGETAVSALELELGAPVVSILKLQDVIEYLDLDVDRDKHRAELIREMKRYRDEHCVLN